MMAHMRLFGVFSADVFLCLTIIPPAVTVLPCWDNSVEDHLYFYVHSHPKAARFSSKTLAFYFSERDIKLDDFHFVVT